MKIIKILFIFFLFILGVKYVSASEITQEDISADYIHFSVDNGPYYIKENLSFRLDQEIKIDDNTVFVFEDGSGICLPNGECIKGRWNFKNGLQGYKIKMRSEFHAIIKDYDGYIEYFVKFFPKLKKKMGFGFLSFYYPVMLLDSWDMSEIDPKKKKVVIYLTEIMGDRLNTPLSNPLGDVFQDIKESLPEDDHQEEDDSELDMENVGDLDIEEVEDLDIEFFKQKKLDPSIVNGKIFLEVENNGEAWYVNPEDGLRYYLGRPEDAFAIMRRLSLGVTHDFITSYSVYPNKVSGKILLDVEDNGKAYYIDPRDNRAYYLGKPADAFNIMRNRGVGITDNDLKRIPANN